MKNDYLKIVLYLGFVGILITHVLFSEYANKLTILLTLFIVLTSILSVGIINIRPMFYVLIWLFGIGFIVRPYPIEVINPLLGNIALILGVSLLTGINILFKGAEELVEYITQQGD